MTEARCDHDFLPGQCFRCKYEPSAGPLKNVFVMVVPGTGHSFHTNRLCPSFTQETTVQRIQAWEALAEGYLPCEYCGSAGSVRARLSDGDTGSDS